MSIPDGVTLERLTPRHAQALVSFYNGLSTASKRTFRPIQEQTTRKVCLDIAVANINIPPTKGDWIALHEQQIIGWGFIWNLDKQDPVFGLAVADAWHGKGLGTALIKHVMTWANAQGLRKITLTVVQDNTVAWRLYEKHGFVCCGAFTHDGDGLDYYRMEYVRFEKDD